MAEPLSVVVVGAGGHGSSTLDAVLLRADQFRVVGIADANPARRGKALYGVPVLGGDSCWTGSDRPAEIRGIVLGVGDNEVRRRVQLVAEREGLVVAIVVQPAATISPHARLGAGTVALAGSIVNAGAAIGRGVILNTGSHVDHDCHIGDFAHVAPGVALAGWVTVGEAAFIGVGAAVVPNVQVGDRATVGAGTTILHDVPAGEVWVGTPARRLR